jgi:hypothetical protein
MVATAVLVAGGISVVSQGIAHAAVVCQVNYTANTWTEAPGTGGFTATITINNTGDPITGWTLAFPFTGGQTGIQGWSANWSQSGANVTATNLSYNGNLGTGASTTIGFNARWSGSNPNPTAFSINGTPCNGAQPTVNLVVTPTTISVPEQGMTTYAVSLSSAPTGNVTVTSTAGTGDADITVTAGGSLTFTPQNWATPQNVTVSAANDADTTNGQRTITVASSGLTSVNVTANEADNDMPPTQAIQLSTTTLSVTENQTATFGVRLASAPTGTVTVTCAVATAGDTSITVSAGTGTKSFTSTNFGTFQNVTVAAAEDADATNGQRVINCTSSGLTTQSVTVTEADNDVTQQAIQLSATSISVPEGGSQTFGVRLAANPGTATVSVACAVATTGDTNLTVVAGTGTKSFTSANFGTFQNVTVAAAEDADSTNGTRVVNCTSTNLTTQSVTATEADNDPAQALVVTPTAVTVPEGGTVMYGVHLASAPTGTVTVTSTAATGGTNDTNITVTGGASLTFTAADFATDKMVTLSAAQDADSANGVRNITVASSGLTSVTVVATEDDDEGTSNVYLDEFMTQYNKIKAASSGYFSPEGVPYHAVETLIVEAPDHGHETTSEAFSFWIWLEAQYGRATGNWAPFNNAWNITEQYIIPTAAGQPGGSTAYNPNDPADYAPEHPQPSGYPSSLSTSVVAGQDPLANELQSTYGNRLVYGMHWLLDVDNIYGYGTGNTAAQDCGDSTARVEYINTYQRGPQESVWETVAHPSCASSTHTYSGRPQANYPSLFVAGSTNGQWRYTNAPDADARAVQAAYWALQWASAQNATSQISATLTKAAKMGDYLRYAFYDKYFKNPGCTSPSCAAGSGKSSSSYMLTWYYAWGGEMAGQWAWRIGSSSWHQGYQNPLAAWILSPAGPTQLRPQSPTAPADWATSLQRQLDSYLWLQSAEGAIAGGATNSWNGQYAAPPAGTPTFYGWAYDFQPVFHDPPSNQWFGFQVWSMHRVAEYYYVTSDAKAKTILDRWAAWALSETDCSTTTGAYSFPSDMTWTGAPSASYSGSASGPAANPNLHVNVVNTATDVGVGAAYARTLTWYAARSGNTAARDMAKCLLDGFLENKDSLGIAVNETRNDYNRFDDPRNDATNTGLFIPSGFTGTMPNGDVINSSSTFLGIRSFYTTDTTQTASGGNGWTAIQNYMNGSGPAPTFRYHRFWAQADLAMALADYGNLFG